MEGGGHDEVASSSKKKTNSRLDYKKSIPYDQNGDKMAKIDTLYMTGGGGHFLIRGYWGRIFTTGLTIMGSHFQ